MEHQEGLPEPRLSIPDDPLYVTVVLGIGTELEAKWVE